jgi:hypothetical protein
MIKPRAARLIIVDCYPLLVTSVPVAGLAAHFLDEIDEAERYLGLGSASGLLVTCHPRWLKHVIAARSVRE